MDYAEFRTLLVKCTDLMNSHPLGVMIGEDNIQPLTPSHLLIGLSQSGQVSREALNDGPDRFTKRARYVSVLRKQWWEAWFSQVFPALLPFRGWVQRQRNLKVGDFMLVQTKKRWDDTLIGWLEWLKLMLMSTDFA